MKKNRLNKNKIILLILIILLSIILTLLVKSIINKNNNIKTQISESEINGIDNSIIEGGFVDENELLEENTIDENDIKLMVDDSEVNKKEDTTNNNSDNSKSYYVKVNVQANVVTIFSKDNNGNYTVPVKSMICSCGTYTPPNNLNSSYTASKYNLNGTRYRWHPLQGNVCGQYTTCIVKNILFHSVPYLKMGDPGSLEYEEYDKLGTTASAGCVRLSFTDAKWIYNNISNGTTVEFYSSSDPGPLGKPSSKKISGNESCRNWDPTDDDKNNPWNNVEKTQTPSNTESQKTESKNQINETQQNNSNNEQNTNKTNKMYELKFETNGGDGVQNQEYEYGETVNLNNIIPIKSGYNFNCWCNDSSLNNKVTSIKMENDLTIYAKWTKREESNINNNTSNHIDFLNNTENPVNKINENALKNNK